MSWFLSRSRSHSTSAAADETALLLNERPEPPQPPSEPPLILLAVDAYGPACRRIHCFNDSNAARQFIKFWYPYRTGDAVVGYWLLASEPLPADAAEWNAGVLILIRDGRPGIVYAHQCPGMAAAREFLRDEMQYGLNLADVLLFWAVPVQIENDFRGDTLLFPGSLSEGVAAGNPSVTALDCSHMRGVPSRARFASL